jgi:hypothetical protein
MWPFKKRENQRPKDPIDIELVAIVDEIGDDEYGLIVCGANYKDGKPVRLVMPRKSEKETTIGSVEYVKLNVDW